MDSRSLSEHIAHRSEQMRHTVGREYEQPEHAYLAEQLSAAGVVDESLHRQQVVPGAKRASTVAEVNAHLATSDAITLLENINAGWNRENEDRLESLRAWREGTYAARLADFRQRFALKEAAKQRAAAEIDALFDRRG